MAKNKNNKAMNTKSKKSYNNRVENQNTTFKENFSHVIKCLLVVLVILGLVYVLTVYITNKNKRLSVTTTAPENIQYDVILAGESFNQPVDDYLVLYFNESGIGMYSEVLSSYTEKENHIKLYKVYANEALNKKFISYHDENKDLKKPDDLLVKVNTLIRFKDNKVSEYITGKDEIIKYLENK